MRRALTLVVAAAAMGPLAGCGVFKAVSAPTTLPPDQVRVPMVEVRAELPALVVDGNQAASDAQVGAFDDAQTVADHLETAWTSVEGTVGAADRATSARIARDQGRIKAGAEHHQLAQIEGAADDQSTAVDGFLAAHR